MDRSAVVPLRCLRATTDGEHRQAAASVGGPEVESPDDLDVVDSTAGRQA
jgi:hypothetical protein